MPISAKNYQFRGQNPTNMIPGGRVWLPADRNGRKQGEIKSQDKWKCKDNCNQRKIRNEKYCVP